jgi:hypothetical protein
MRELRRCNVTRPERDRTTNGAPSINEPGSGGGKDCPASRSPSGSSSKGSREIPANDGTLIGVYGRVDGHGGATGWPLHPGRRR